MLFTSNMWPSSAPVRDISFPNFSDIDFDLSTSLKVNVIMVPLDSAYDLILEFHSNIWLLRHIISKAERR